MKHLLLAAFAVLQCLRADAQTTLNLVNNTSQDIYAAYAIYDEDDGWTTHGWYKISPYDERDLDLDDYSGTLYIHGHNSGGEWGRDTRLCTGGSSAFHVMNADKIRCEYSRGFSKTSVSSGGTKTWRFNP